jgi:predicted nuclease of predicted toxin-antitoxin system
MHFLVDVDLPRSANTLLRQNGHETSDVRDIGLRGASDAEVTSYAQKHKLCLLTGDKGFADIRNYPPGKYSGIVVLLLPAKATSSNILAILKNLLTQVEIITRLDGKLAIVELNRIRVRKG